MNKCCYCERPIEGSSGWGMSQLVGEEENKVFHLECAEMNGDDVVVNV